MTKKEAKHIVDNFPFPDDYVDNYCNVFGNENDYYNSKKELTERWFQAFAIAYPPDNQPKKD